MSNCQSCKNPTFLKCIKSVDILLITSFTKASKSSKNVQGVLDYRDLNYWDPRNTGNYFKVT